MAAYGPLPHGTLSSPDDVPNYGNSIELLHHPDLSEKFGEDGREASETSDPEFIIGQTLISPLVEPEHLVSTHHNDLDSSPTSMESPETEVQWSRASLSAETTLVEGKGSNSLLESPSAGEKSKTSSQGRLPLKESLGRTGITTVLGGSVVILAGIAFLSLLWFGYGDAPEAADAPRLWRQIALKDWMTRTITISSLVLRSVVSFQVALCTSMIAALVLEKRLTRKSDVAYLSITRSISDGPRKLVQLLLCSGSWSVLAYVELWLISLLALVMLALQFSSTLLLSDIHSYVIVGDEERTPVANFGTFTGFFDGSGDLATLEVDRNNPANTIFGEARMDYDVTPTVSGLSDTGVVQRSYLPFVGSENRTSVRSYRGPTLVINSRVTCVPPLMKGHFSSRDPNYADVDVGHLLGNVKYGESIRKAKEGVGPLCDTRGCESVPFDCSVPSTFYNGYRQSNFCFIETVGRNSQELFDLLSISELEYYGDREMDPWAVNSTMFLVFRSNVNVFDWGDQLDLHPLPPASTSGEWSKFEITKGQSVDISLCFSRIFVQPRYVSIVAHEQTHEPTVEWDGLTRKHNTTAVSTFMNPQGPHSVPSRRGVMDMEVISELKSSKNDVKRPYNPPPPRLTALVLYRTILQTITNNLTPGSMSGCIFCSDWSIPGSLENELVFTDNIEATGRAAVALHSHFASEASIAYNGLLKVFNVTQPVDLAATISVRTPGPCSEHQCSGFISVTTLLCVHLVIVVVITMLFVGQARFSRLSNTWHAISQLVSEELEDFLDRGNNAKDKPIKKALKRDGMDDFVQLGLADGNDRVRVLKCPTVG
ncbi:hypothetical protein F4802DRAFT_598152 [Xylaria palmicola]|nr:hypothetical protein F4802DRAFT_598152 [Xylaria palmicola]